MTISSDNQTFIQADKALKAAYCSLGDAAYWLCADWDPSNQPTSETAARRMNMLSQIATAKAAIDEARS